ncbi:hypothetical protein WICMUC_002040 [Wickerhamomyces mucosus]|uniref:Uncharacterized protein n=1 Tax=Wickerhamomyces mucosus TaxID=1378264 RepID=A0A9P8PSB3_9ASCO|nr:hypothetical protein WICMUC_002040 [Wickerhamomyces mucosus]
MSDLQFEFDLELENQQEEQQHLAQQSQIIDYIDSPLLSSYSHNEQLPELSNSLASSVSNSLLQTPLLYDSKINTRNNSIIPTEIESLDLNESSEYVTIIQNHVKDESYFEHQLSSDLNNFKRVNDVINMGSKQLQLNYQKWMNTLKY